MINFEDDILIINDDVVYDIIGYKILDNDAMEDVLSKLLILKHEHKNKKIVLIVVGFKWDLEIKNKDYMEIYLKNSNNEILTDRIKICLMSVEDGKKMKPLNELGAFLSHASDLYKKRKEKNKTINLFDYINSFEDSKYAKNLK